MSSATLLAAAAVDVVIAGVIGYVGARLAVRTVEPAARRANLAFATWWFALAAGFLLNALWEASAALGVTTGPALVATDYLYVLTLVAAVWGILAYLVYLRWGTGRAFVPLLAFYGLYAGVALWALSTVEPTGLNVAVWFVGWSYASFESGSALYTALLALLLLPQLAAVIAYGLLWRRTSDPRARRRIATVTLGSIVIVVLPVVADLLKLGRFEAWQAGGRFLSLAAAVAILRAYRPSAAPTRAKPDAAADREARLRARVRDLV